VSKRCFCLGVSLLAAASVQAQDIHFSQFFESALLRNPALTGIFSGDYKATVNYRSQWGSFGVPFQTALAAGETKVLLREATGDYMSFGLTTVYDKAGSLNFASMAAYAAVNYNKALGSDSRTYLSVGLCGGYIQRSFDISKVRTASQFAGGSYSASNAAGENLAYTAIRHWDASAGISLSGRISPRANYYLGFAGYHISQPAESYYEASFIRLTTRWSANFGISANLGNGYGLTVHTNYQYQQPYQETIGGFMLSHGFRKAGSDRPMLFSAGCYYRLQDAWIPMARLEYQNWAATISYDVIASGKRLYMSGFGGYEFSLSFRGVYPRHERNNGTECPRFEIDNLNVDQLQR